MQKITPFMWFDRNCEEAINYYVSVFSSAPNATGESKVLNIKRYPSGITEGPMAGFDGKVLTGVFTLAGQKFMALDGGPIFKAFDAVLVAKVDELSADTKGSFLLDLSSYKSKCYITSQAYEVLKKNKEKAIEHFEKLNEVYDCMETSSTICERISMGKNYRIILNFYVDFIAN
jgi:uncharacterized glyoxalase superfamily protein PhnB